MENDLFTSSSWWQTMETLPIPNNLFYDPHSPPLDQRPLQLRSVPNSMTSSPAASESNNISGNALAIGKLRESPTDTNSTHLNSPATALTSAEEVEEAPVKRSGETKCSRKRKAAVVKEKAKGVEGFQDYIHVRARRGEATDSHSLAERVRREKIGERMQILQDLVPGCDKVTGKAVMLDEIINYVQSLQFQVEFLSMKLATVDKDRAQSPKTDDIISMFQLSNISPIPNQHLDFSPADPSIVGATFPTNCLGAIFTRL